MIIDRLDEAAGVPAEQRIVTETKDHGIKHATAINIFGGLMTLLLVAATGYLACHR
jgi:hypothetical protein